MTDKELYDYFWKMSAYGEVTREQQFTMFQAKDFWHQLQDKVCEKYGERLMAPTHVWDTHNPFIVHFTWDYKDGNVLGCSVNEEAEIYVNFNNDSLSWKEYLTLEDLKIPDRLMEVFYLYYLEKKNDH